MSGLFHLVLLDAEATWESRSQRAAAKSCVGAILSGHSHGTRSGTSRGIRHRSRQRICAQELQDSLLLAMWAADLWLRSFCHQRMPVVR